MSVQKKRIKEKDTKKAKPLVISAYGRFGVIYAEPSRMGTERSRSARFDLLKKPPKKPISKIIDYLNKL